ncbi:MAG: tetratricopeptide repeat protein, partial [Nitrospirota bacterium]
MQFIVYLLILIFVPITSAYANPVAPDFEVTIEKGKIFFNNSEYAKALEEFNSAVSAKPDDPAANWWLGVSHLKAGNHEKAIAPLIKATRDPELSAAANYYLGTAYYKLGFYDDAKESFEAVLAHSPPEDLKSYAHDYLDNINKQISGERMGVPAKPLELTFIAGIQYDTNAILSPDDERLVSIMGIKKGASDWRSILYLDGTYNLLNKENWLLGVGYSVYQNFHKRHSSFNTNVQSLSAFSKYSKDPISVKAEYDYEYTFFGGHRFSSIHSISPVLTIAECPQTYSELTYAYHKN